VERKFYVLNYDFNSKKMVMYNIFNNARLTEGIDELIANFITYEDFREKLKNLLMYCFWSKREYEIMATDLFEDDPGKWEKIDIYYQVLPNIDVIAKIIIDCHNENIEG